MSQQIHLQTSSQKNNSAYQLAGISLPLAWLIWIGLVLLTLVLVGLGIEPRRVEMLTPCEQPDCLQDGLSVERQEAFAELGIKAEGYFGMLETFSLGIVALSCLLGVVIVSRNPAGLITLITSLFFIIVSAMATFNLDALARSDPRFDLPARIISAAGSLLVVLVFYLFPDGRFVPRWGRWFVMAYSIFLVWGMFSSGLNYGSTRFPPTAFNVAIYSAIFGGGIAMQIYRYRKVSSPVERQQTKWVVATISLNTVIYLVSMMLVVAQELTVDDSTGGMVMKTGLFVVYLCSLLLLEVGFVISILRYHLWDISFYLNRTAIYGGAAVLSVLIYLGVIVGLHELLSYQDAHPALMIVEALGLTGVGMALVFGYERLRRYVDVHYPPEELSALKTPYLSTLAGLAVEGNKKDSPDGYQAIWEKIADLIGQMIPYDALNIMLVEEGYARVVYARGYAERGLTEIKVQSRFRLEDTPSLQRMVRSGESLVLNDISQWKNIRTQLWLSAYLGVPLYLEGGLYGFINLDNIQPDSFTARHRQQMQIVAAYLAATLKHQLPGQDGQALVAQLEELERQNIELDNFSHMVAHDLKGPLHIIQGFADVILTDHQTEISEEVQILLQYIREGVGRMERIIRDLLLLATVQEVEQHLARVEVDKVVAGVVHSLEGEIHKRGVRIEVQADLPAALGQPQWVEQVFANLIANAIKYIGDTNPAPLVCINGFEVDKMVRYEVVDNGLGIAVKDQMRLFEPFNRFHPEQATGTGLGLSIVKRIVVKMGGEIGAESVPGKGSTFWFTLKRIG